MNSRSADPANVRSKRDDKLKEYLAHAVLLVGVLSLAVTAWFLWKGKNDPTEAETDVQFLLPPPVPKPMAEGNAMGNPEAPVKIVEFSDFQCQYCRQFFLQTEPALIENYVTSGDVYFVYRSLGDWLGPDSQIAAEAAYCAGDQKKFWEFHDALFSNQGLISFSNENLLKLGKELGLDTEELAICLDSNRSSPQVLQDLQDGLQAGVRGTPSFLINGKMVTGAQPFNVFQIEIDSALMDRRR
jgi:protein-disulfide isomerase